MGYYIKVLRICRRASLLYISPLVLVFLGLSFYILQPTHSVFASGLTTPTLINPADNSNINTSSYSHSWSAVPGAIRYQYESYYDSSATLKKWSATYTSTRKTDTNSGDIVYWWRVRAIDVAGNMSPWSNLFKFTIDNTAPIVTVGAAGSGSQSEYYGPRFVIKGVVGAQEKNLASHKLEITKPDGASYIVGPVMSTDNVYTHTLDSSSGDGVYKVKYTATDKAGNVSLPAEILLTIDTIKPALPPVLTGLTDRFMQPGKITRSWVRSLDESDIYGYAYKSFKSYNDALNSPETTNHNFYYLQPANTSGVYDLVGETGSLNRTFYYRVAAVDKAGNKTWSSEIHSVTVDSTAPSAPVVSSPTLENNTLTNNSNLVVQWNQPSEDTAKYKLRYYNDISGSDLKLDTPKLVEITSQDWSGELEGGTGRYYLQVQAIDRAGNESAWSDVFTVNLDVAAPDAPELKANGVSDNLTNNPAITMSWGKPSDDTTKYNFRYYTTIPGAVWSEVNPCTTEVTTEEWAGVLEGESGMYFIQVQAVDHAGNVSEWSTPYELTLDTIAPVITINPIASVQTPNNVSITALVDDAIVTSLRVIINDVDMGSVEVVDGVATYVVPAPIAGVYVVKLQASDTAGNPAEALQNFTVTTPPPVVIVQPEVPATPIAPNTPQAPQQSQPSGQNSEVSGSNEMVATVNGQASASGDDAGEVFIENDTTQNPQPRTNNGVDGGKTDSAQEIQGASDKKAFDWTFGTPWWGWLLVLISIAGGWWIIAALKRRRKQEE